MNKELFSSMQRQLTPSPQARAELDALYEKWEQLSEEAGE